MSKIQMQFILLSMFKYNYNREVYYFFFDFYELWEKHFFFFSFHII